MTASTTQMPLQRDRAASTTQMPLQRDRAASTTQMPLKRDRTAPDRPYKHIQFLYVYMCIHMLKRILNTRETLYTKYHEILFYTTVPIHLLSVSSIDVMLMYVSSMTENIYIIIQLRSLFE